MKGKSEKERCACYLQIGADCDREERCNFNSRPGKRRSLGDGAMQRWNSCLLRFGAQGRISP